VRITIGLFIMGVLASCGKQNQPIKDCHCGTIVNDGIVYEKGENKYWFDVKNACSGQTKRVHTSPDIWSETYNGDPICLEDQNGW